MELDFTRLREIGNLPTEEPVKERPEPQEQITGLALIRLDREREDRKRIAEAYRKYQVNIRLSELLRGEILKGAKAGENPRLLFLEAVKCISAMTGDELFYKQIEESMRSDGTDV